MGASVVDSREQSLRRSFNAIHRSPDASLNRSSPVSGHIDGVGSSHIEPAENVN